MSALTPYPDRVIGSGREALSGQVQEERDAKGTAVGQAAEGEGVIAHTFFAHKCAAHHIQRVEGTDRSGGVVFGVRTPASVIVSLVRDGPDRPGRFNLGQAI